RIRGGARLRSYHSYARRMSAADYVVKVVHGELDDQTLSFQLHEGFHVLAVGPPYLNGDPEPLGYAARREWLDPKRLHAHDVADRPTGFLHEDVAAQQLGGESRR